jgi:hypothetical protein
MERGKAVDLASALFARAFAGAVALNEEGEPIVDLPLSLFPA